MPSKETSFFFPVLYVQGANCFSFVKLMRMKLRVLLACSCYSTLVFLLKKLTPLLVWGVDYFWHCLFFLSKMHYIVKGVLRMKALSETSGKGVTSISLLSWLNKGLQLYFPWVFDTACKYSLLIWNAFPRSGIFGFAKMV